VREAWGCGIFQEHHQIAGGRRRWQPLFACHQHLFWMSEDLVHNFVARYLVNVGSSYNNSNDNKFRLGFAPVQLLFLVSI
jgi:hypothetical protein